MNKNSKITPRALASLLTILALIFTFCAFCIGTFGASFMISGEPKIKWSFCGPHLIFMILGFVCVLLKFCLCTIQLKKDYSSKDTITVQFALEIIDMIALVIGCLVCAFIPGAQPADKIIVPILISSLVFVINGACAGLAYHNYK